MALVPGLGSGGDPPDMTGRIWFQRGCVGLAFALWSAALALPLARIGTWGDDGVVATDKVYPMAAGQAPGLASLFVVGTIVAIVAAGIAVATQSADDPGLWGFFAWLMFAAVGWCLVGGIGSVVVVGLSHVRDGGHAFVPVEPLAGTWLIWAATAVLAIPVVMAVRE